MFCLESLLLSGGVSPLTIMASTKSKLSGSAASRTARLLASARRLERTERRIYRALCSCETKLSCLMSERNSVIELIGKLQEDHRKIMKDIAVKRAECGAMEYVPEGMFASPAMNSLESIMPTFKEVVEAESSTSQSPIQASLHGLDIFCYETIWSGSPFRDETRSALPGTTDAPVWENLDWLTKDFPELTANAQDTSGGLDTFATQRLS